MMLTGEQRNARRKTFPSSTVSTIDLMGMGLGPNEGFRGERPGV